MRMGMYTFTESFAQFFVRRVIGAPPMRVPIGFADWRMIMWLGEWQHESSASAEAAWAVWSDFSTWSKWDPHTEAASLEGEIKQGAVGKYKPAGAPGSRLRVVEFEPGRRFLNEVKLPLARILADHEVVPTESGCTLINRFRVEGLAAPFWRRMLGKRLDIEHPEMLAALAATVEGGVTAKA